MKHDIKNIKIFLESLKEVFGTETPVALHEPFFTDTEKKYVQECVETGWVSYAGKFVSRFEQMLQDYTGAKFAVATVNGTLALHICLKLAGVGQEDEVLIQDLTFVASANAIKYCGAIPHFVDVESKTLGLDPLKLDRYLSKISRIKNGECFNKITGRKIKAVMPMHTFGHPVDIDPLRDICKKYRIVLIEDAAQSLGSLYKGKHTGTFGKLSALSFNGNKIITTGGGGAIITNDPKLAKLAKHITTTAKIPHPYEFFHDQVGYNYRMPNINAALGCAQMEKLDKFIEQKRGLAKKYQKKFLGTDWLTIFKEAEFARSNYWLNTAILNKEFANLRDEIIELAHKQKYFLRPAWKLMHTLPMFKDCPKMDLTNAIDLQKRIINLPSSAFLFLRK